jgi:hypothetical protein
MVSTIVPTRSTSKPHDRAVAYSACDDAYRSTSYIIEPQIESLPQARSSPGGTSSLGSDLDFLGGSFRRWTKYLEGVVDEEKRTSKQPPEQQLKQTSCCELSRLQIRLAFASAPTTSLEPILPWTAWIARPWWSSTLVRQTTLLHQVRALGCCSGPRRTTPIAS